MSRTVWTVGFTLVKVSEWGMSDPQLIPWRKSSVAETAKYSSVASDSKTVGFQSRGKGEEPKPSSSHSNTFVLDTENRLRTFVVPMLSYLRQCLGY